MTSVFSSRPCSSSVVEDLADRPVDLLDHVAVTGPACDFPANLSETNSGTCGIACAT